MASGLHVRCVIVDRTLPAAEPEVVCLAWRSAAMPPPWHPLTSGPREGAGGG